MSARTVLLVSAVATGGVAQHLKDLAALLRDDGAEVTVAAPAVTLAALDAEQDDSNVVLPVAASPSRQDLSAWRTLRGLSRGAEVVHAHGVRAGALSVLAARSIRRRWRPRIVVTVHNAPVGSRRVRWTASVLEMVTAGADVILTVSEDLRIRMLARTRIRRGWAAVARQSSPVVERAVVPAPARTLEMPRTQAAVTQRRAVARFLLEWSAARPVLVTVARLAPQKGLDTVLAAAAELRTPQVRWIIAGEGPLRASLERDIAARGLQDRVELWGRRHDVPTLLAGADLVVSAARWEGQPIAVMEALQAGAAIVATDAGGTREVTDGAALIVPVGSTRPLAREIDRLLAEPESLEQMRRAAIVAATRLAGPDDLLAQLRRAYLSDTPRSRN